MLQGHAEMLAGDKRRRIAAVLLLANVGLIVLAAFWRHAAADDPALAKPSASEQPENAPQVELPAPEQSDRIAPPTVPATHRADDAVMEELRKVIRDSESGLELPRLDETSPLASHAQPSPSPSPSPSGAWDARLQQRIETVHSLSAAALALVREARSLTDAGLTAESAALMQRAAELREMIAALSAKPAGQR